MLGERFLAFTHAYVHAAFHDWLFACMRPSWRARTAIFAPANISALYSEKEDLEQLSALGHFLKGSSATLGLTKVKDSCEKIQHYGARKDETGNADEPDDKKSLEKLRKTIAQAEQEFRDVEKILRKFYNDEE